MRVWLARDGIAHLEYLTGIFYTVQVNDVVPILPPAVAATLVGMFKYCSVSELCLILGGTDGFY